MKKEKFDIYEIIKKFPDDDLKKLYQSENNGRMRTRLLCKWSTFPVWTTFVSTGKGSRALSLGEGSLQAL